MNNNTFQKYYLILAIIVLSFVYYQAFILADNTLVSRLQGRILLQVEDNGEAWYVYPETDERHYLGRPQDAFSLMRKFGLGISNNDIRKIPIASLSFAGLDSDQDGLSDMLEDAIGSDKNSKDSDNDGFEDKAELEGDFDPNGQGQINYDPKMAQDLSGLILIQAEQNGEAWYLNPQDQKRYFLGRPRDAFNIMRQTGLGISNEDLIKIAVYQAPNYSPPKNTVLLDDGKRKYSDTEHKFSLKYPSNWKMEKIQGEKEVLFLRNYKEDIMEEGKAIITVAFIENKEDLDLDKFKTASKNDGKKTASELTTINNFETLKETFEFSKVDSQETTNYVQLNDHEMLMVTLFSAGNHNYHSTIMGDLLRSIEYNDS